jgi:hypothetical protein
MQSGGQADPWAGASLIFLIQAPVIADGGGASRLNVSIGWAAGVVGGDI